MKKSLSGRPRLNLGMAQILQAVHRHRYRHHGEWTPPGNGRLPCYARLEHDMIRACLTAPGPQVLPTFGAEVRQYEELKRQSGDRDYRDS